MSHRPGQEGEAWINNQDKAPYVVSLLLFVYCVGPKKKYAVVHQDTEMASFHSIPNFDATAARAGASARLLQ